MQVITTHLNADFDCLASMVAARKLYPKARMVFSGSAERSVNRYLEERGGWIEISRLKSIDLDRVETLILVDTQSPKRIGGFGPLVKKPGVAVHVFDHHPDAGDALGADRATVCKRGAATTVLVETLVENGMVLNPEESTLMALGIFEDTHSLLSVSVTPEDFSALALLVEWGADLTVVAEYVQPRLNNDLVEVLNDLIRNLETLRINGVDVHVATASPNRFVEDLSHAVQKLVDLENLAVFVALVRVERQIYLIGRSREPQVDVGEIAAAFGGGGHSYAASATIRDLTLAQVREKLQTVLERVVQPPRRVADIMHFPVVSVKKSDTIQAVEKKLTRFNLNTLPVLEGARPVGLITRQTVEKAIHHQLTKEKTEALMIREFSVTTPEAFFKTIQPIMIEDKQKLIPVVDPKKGHLVGIVSRGDLLRTLHGDMLRDGSAPGSGVKTTAGARKNIKSLLKKQLDKSVMQLFAQMAAIADQEGMGIHVVGGFVRDLLLGEANLDLDIVVEGDGIAFAKKAAKKLKGRVKSHAKFGTSVVILENGLRIDVATARMEYYKHPAALPTVEKSSIKADLFRRDFSINSLAVKLNGPDAFTLLDYFNGERDLKDKLIRVLHNLSFIEDPCRIFRAIRFEQRFHFTLGKQTEAFMKNAVQKGWVDALSGSRLLNELILLMKEAAPVKCVRRMREFELFACIAPAMLKDAKQVAPLDRIEGVLAWAERVPVNAEPEVWYVYFLGLFYELDRASFRRAADRLKLPMRLRKRLEADRESCRESLPKLKDRKKRAPSEVYDLFSSLSSEAVIFLLALANSDRVNNQATLYFSQYHGSAKLSLTGDDLIRMGIAPGPVFQKVFKTLRDARVNGNVKSKREEMALVKEKFIR